MAFGFRAEEEEGLLGSDGLLVLKEIAEIEQAIGVGVSQVTVVSLVFLLLRTLYQKNICYWFLICHKI